MTETEQLPILELFTKTETQYTQEQLNVINELIEKAKPLLALRCLQTSETLKLNEEIAGFIQKLQEINMAFTEIKAKLDSLEKLKGENSKLEREVLEKMAHHPELNNNTKTKTEY